MSNVLIQDNSLILRTVTENDKESILGIYRQCEDFLALGPVPKASLKMVEEDMETSQREGGCFCGIYHTDGHLIGIIDFISNGFERKQNLAFISLLMIAFPFRKQGIGTKIINLIEKEIKKDARITEIHSGVQVNNPEAIKFWQRNGYRIISNAELFPDTTIVYRLCKSLCK